MKHCYADEKCSGFEFSDEGAQPCEIWEEELASLDSSGKDCYIKDGRFEVSDGYCKIKKDNSDSQKAKDEGKVDGYLACQAKCDAQRPGCTAYAWAPSGPDARTCKVFLEEAELAGDG